MARSSAGIIAEPPSAEVAVPTEEDFEEQAAEEITMNNLEKQVKDLEDELADE